MMGPRETDELPLRGYRPGDEGPLVELFAHAFPRPIGEEDWRWKLKSRPASVENVFLVTSEDRPVFQYAAIPMEYSTPFGRHTAMLSVDTMTHPDFRRRGLLTRVVRVAYERWAASGVPFVIGIPNDRWGSRRDVLGWKPLLSMRTLVRPLRIEALARRRLELAQRKLGFSGRRLGLGVSRFVPRRGASSLHDAVLDRLLPQDRSIAVTELDTVDESIDELWSRLARGRIVSGVKNSSWVRWRFLEAPGARYRVLIARRREELVGYAVYGRPSLTDPSIATLAELVVLDGERGAAGDLIRAVHGFAVESGADKLQVLAISGSSDERFFRRGGFWFARERVQISIVHLRPDLAPVWNVEPSKWCLTGADFDIH